MHGPTAEFLADKPLFAALADEFLTFVDDARRSWRTARALTSLSQRRAIGRDLVELTTTRQAALQLEPLGAV